MTHQKYFSHFHSSLLLLVSFTIFFAFLVPTESLNLLVLSSLVCAIALTPLYFSSEKNAIFSPFTLVFILTFFSSLGKFLFLLFTTDKDKIYSFLQLDSNLYALYSGIFIMCLFMVAYSSTILLLHKRILKSTKSCIDQINKCLTSTTQNNRALVACLFAILFTSLVFFVVFIKINNINLLTDSLSAKRFLNIEGGIGNRINSLSYWLYKSVFIVKVSFYIAILLVLNKRSIPNFSLVLVTYSYLIFLSTFFSNRTELLFATAELSIIFFTLNKKQIYSLISFLVITMVLYLAISILREGASNSADPLNHLLGRRYLSGIDKLGIMHDYYLQHPLEQQGKSLVGIIGLVIPYYSEGVYAYFNLFRQITMSEVYATIPAGAPPGAIIEVFANFKYFGVILLGAFFGVLTNFLHCLLLHSKNKLILLITFAVIIRVCFLFINTNFIIGFVRIALDIGPFILTLMIIRISSSLLKKTNYSNN